MSKTLCKFENLFMKNHSCVSCGVEIPDGSRFSLCKNCQNSIHVIDGNVCKFCGDKVLSFGLVCDSCKNRVYDFQSNRSCFYYDDVVSRIIKNLKYNSQKYVADYVSELMLTRREFFEGADIITFVPINRRRLAERGFNQSEEIAKLLGEKLGIQVANLLIKKDGGKHQAGLDMKKRLTNPYGSFEIDNCNSALVKGKNVLIVDDVFTTGSTLSECSRMLKRLKPKSIRTVTFAKTDFHSSNSVIF